MDKFDIVDAPQFSTFDDTNIENVETYFEVHHDIMCKKPTAVDQSLEDYFYSPMPLNMHQSQDVSSDDNTLELRNRKIRRSMSSGNIPSQMKYLENALRKTHLKSNVPKQPNNTGTFKYGQLKKSSSSSQSRINYISQDNLNRLAAPKKFHSSVKNLAVSSNEYVSVAEAVKKFQERTPTRFHSKSKSNPGLQKEIPVKLKVTIPHSPMLLTKRRAKPNTNVMSYEDREKLEFEEQQKFKIKANPLNKKILQQPLKAIHVEKKIVTHPEPFNLSKVEPKKIAPSPKKEDYRFRANPIPKSILEPPKLPEKKPLKVTHPVTPTFVKTLPKASPVKKTLVRQNSSPLKKTRPEPFSFEKRDQQLLQKREELIKKTMEEEKKAREFHARPIPKPIASIINQQKHKVMDENSILLPKEELRKKECVTEEHFKARPPVVLYQKPFEPKKIDHPLTEIQPFQLASETRAKERENFERKKKELEEMSANLLRQDEEERLREEQEEIKRIRKEIEFKAQPIKHFKGIEIKPSGKVTEPISPVFRSGKSNKENVV
ncbi:hypothetical protein WA026_009503 [Henosepilachna vigintioctopunctata]|uniref:Targeting protein for Xklp2 n=1 Tax=Henosepilachna vigintioctopunctata TaxID=420089 RepID=A0AAW1U534_9CUCU